MEVIKHLLDFSGIGSGRICLRWVSAAEGRLFAEYVTDFSRRVHDLGPFDPSRYSMELAALEATLRSKRLRWLMGMELQLTEKSNVYGQQVSEEDYRKLLRQAAEDDYQCALVAGAIREEPLSVREIAFKTGLPVYTVSQKLGELEMQHLAEIHAFEGTTPKFAAELH